jgi:1,4-alpha-glucan branching enzyme
MIRCEPMRGGKKVKVTFAVPADGMNGDALAVVGDFNDWDPTATPLLPEGNVRTAMLTLPAGRRYAFRYLAGGGTWFNDENAHDYQRNDFGGDDSVLDTSSAG